MAEKPAPNPQEWGSADTKDHFPGRDPYRQVTRFRPEPGLISVVLGVHARRWVPANATFPFKGSFLSFNPTGAQSFFSDISGRFFSINPF